MTEHHHDDALPLPGLEPPPRPPSALEAAVRRSVVDLRDRDLLTEGNALELELMLTLARIVGDKERSGKTSTVNADARLLWEIRNSFNAAEAEGDERLREAMAEFNAALDAAVVEDGTE